MPNRKTFLIAAAIPLLFACTQNQSATPSQTQSAQGNSTTREDALMEQVKQADQAGRSNEVIEKAPQVIALNEGNVEARFLLAQAYEHVGQHQKAVDEIEWLLSRKLVTNLQMLQNLLFVEGTAYLNMNDLPKAEKCLETASELETDSFNPMLLGAYAEVLVTEKKYDEAIVELDQAIALEPKEARMQWLRGQAYYNKGDLDKAMLDYEAANELDPGNARIATEYAILLERKQLYRQALYALAYCKEVNPQASLPQDLHDRIWQEAFAQATKDQQQRPEAPVPYTYLAFLYYDTNDLDNAKKSLNKAFQYHGDLVPLAWRLKGDLAMADGNYSEAVSDYDKSFSTFHPKKAGRDLGQDISRLHKKKATEKLGGH
jgi:tetratricopeptide (TPR) repeat protein